MIRIIASLSRLLDHDDKRFILLLLLLTVLFSVIEVVGVSAVMPFIVLASNPESFQGGFYAYLFSMFEIKNKNGFIFYFGILLISFYFVKAAYGSFYMYFLNKFCYGSYSKFSYRLFSNYVYLPYSEFVKRNTASMSKMIVTETYHLSQLVQAVLLACAEILIILFFYIMLLFVDAKMTLVLTLVLSVKVFLITKIISNVIKKQGENRAALQDKFYRIINEVFGNFKIIKLFGNEKQIFKSFKYASEGYARSNIIASTLSQTPKNVLESIGFSALIATVLYILYVYGEASQVIPIISMYALALFRILPAINRVLFNYNQILFLSKSLEMVNSDLICNKEVEMDIKVDFNSKIELKNVSFTHGGLKVIDGISLIIEKGDKLAFFGESGSGKSTLIDLIAGLYKPHIGKIMIDEIALDASNIKSWRQKIGYIPQAIYLFDGTVGENVAFGHTYDENRIIEVLKKANIYNFLLTKDGIYTAVGDAGIQLSGGQKQRIGIARALYSDPEILILDEATSALDNDTESKIMDEIYDIGMDKTLLIVAHRLSTIERCSKKIKLSKGRIIEEAEKRLC